MRSRYRIEIDEFVFDALEVTEREKQKTMENEYETKWDGKQYDLYLQKRYIRILQYRSVNRERVVSNESVMRTKAEIEKWMKRKKYARHSLLQSSLVVTSSNHLNHRSD